MKIDKKVISRVQEKKYGTKENFSYREQLEDYFSVCDGSNVEKLQTFARYVPRQDLTRFLARYELFKLILEVHGSILEFGVYMGQGLFSFAHLSSIFEPVHHMRKVVGFDTWEGIIDVDKKDTSLNMSDFTKKSGLKTDSYNDILEGIKLFDKNRFLSHIEKIKVVKGDASKTVHTYLAQHPETVIALLYLDVDLYKPTLDVLKACWDRIPVGGLIVFDELNADNFPGETLAVKEFIGFNNLELKRFSFNSCVSYAIKK